MADNLFPEAVVSASTSKLAFAETTFGGDTVFVGASFLGIITGAEGSRTFTPLVAGAGVVDGGTQRVTLASDDPAVAKLAYGSTTGGGVESGALRVTIASDSTGLVSVDDNGGSLTVDNSTLAVVGGGTEAAAMRVTIATDSTGVLSVDDNGGNLSIDDGGNSITVDYATTGSGNATGALRVELANNGTGVLATLGTITNVVHVDDNAGSITVDGTVAFSNTTIAVTNVGTFAVQAVCTNAGTFVVQENGAALTSLQLIDDVVYTDDTSTHATGTSKGVLFMAAATPTDTSVNANDIGAVGMTVDRKLHVAVMDALPAGTAAIGKLAANAGVTIGAVEIAAAQTLATVTTVSTVTLVSTLTGSGVAAGAADSGNPHKIGGVYHTSGNVPTYTTGQRADWELGSRGAGNVTLYGQNTTTPIDARVVADTQSSGTGLVVNAQAQTYNGASWDRVVSGNGASGIGVARVTIANDSTGILAGVTTVTTLTGSAIAHDGADSGNPHKIGAKATTALSGKTMVADNDRTDLFAATDGVLITRNVCLEDVVQERTTNTDGVSTAFASGLAAPGAGVRLWITSVTIANSSAAFCTVDLRDGSAGSVLWTCPVPATGGFTFKFDPPLKLSTNTALAFDASAATSTLSISANGFKSKL